MLGNSVVAEEIENFEAVEWPYDGLDGAVIKWTKEHENDNDDPGPLAWVLDAEENVVGMASTRDLRDAEGFLAWLEEMKGAHAKATGQEPAEMLVQWSVPIFRDPGKDEPPGTILEGLKAAQDDKIPLLGFVALPESAKEDKKLKAMYAQTVKFETGALADKELADLADRCYTVRFDFTDEKTRKYLEETWDIKKAPALFVIDWTASKPKPRVWTNSALKAKEITAVLKKLLPAPEDE